MSDSAKHSMTPREQAALLKFVPKAQTVINAIRGHSKSGHPVMDVWMNELQAALAEDVAALEAGAQALDAGSEMERSYRAAMWLNHGHDTVLYGDDGEMQCARCGAEWKCYDYKNAPLADVERAYNGARLKSISEALDAGGWQPIETAPRLPHTEILLHRPGWITPRVRAGKWFEIAGYDAPNNGYWVANGLQVHPTHWQPLPAPPGDHP